MRMRKALVATAAITIILGFLVVVPVHAQVDFDAYLGQWFKGNMKDKGFIVLADNLGTEKAVDKSPGYVYVQSSDGANYVFLVVQQDDEGNWMEAVPYQLTVLGQNPLDHIAYGFLPPPPALGAVPGVEILSLVLHITGKEKEEDGEWVLKSAQGQTVGGCVIYDFLDGTYFAANEALKFKLVPEAKVPVEVYEKVFPPEQ